MNNCTFSQNFFITQNMVGRLKNVVNPTGILDLLQTIAGLHAKQLGFSMQDLIKRGYCWVLESVYYKKYADIPEQTQVTVTTTPIKPNRAFYFRDYTITDTNGKTLLTATARWLVVNTSTKKIDTNGVVDYKLDLPEKSAFAPYSRIRIDFTTAETLGTYTIRKSDTDILSHMNNTRYADVIFEFYPNNIDSLQIEYIKECKAGEQITVKQVITEQSIYMAGFVNDEKRFVCAIYKD